MMADVCGHVVQNRTFPEKPVIVHKCWIKSPFLSLLLSVIPEISFLPVLLLSVVSLPVFRVKSVECHLEEDSL